MVKLGMKRIIVLSFFILVLAFVGQVVLASQQSNQSEPKFLVFNFSSESPIAWGDVKFKIIYKDGSEKLVDDVYPDIEKLGDSDSVNSNISQFFAYSADIEKIEIVSGHDLQIHYYSGDRESTISTDNFANQTFKRSFFNNLGLNVKLREEWGAPTTSMWQPWIASQINKVVIHHTVFPNNPDDLSSVVRSIYEDHKNRCADNSGYYDPNKPNCDEPHELWQDIGYNFLIDQEGNIYEGRAGGLGVTGAHSPPNYGTIGISLIGNFQEETPNPKAIESLKLLLARMSDYWGLDLTWTGDLQGSVVGHRHRQLTLCPGDNLYSILNQQAFWNEVRALKFQNMNLNNVLNYIDQLGAGVNVALTSGGTTDVLIQKNSVNQQQLYYFSSLYYVEQITQLENFYLLKVEKDLVEKFIKDVMLIDPNIKIQPNFVYRFSSWDNTNLNKSLPSDYVSTVHWYLDKMNVPEAWKVLGGCEVDNSCGGNQSVVVAVIDTGVAYENFDYDAGGGYQLQNFSGLNIEVPTTIQNNIYNEGYDRRFFQSPELSHVNFVSPYDASQKFLCDLRLGSPSACNSFELEKINHANDDSGHGTFVTTIIAGKTGDASPNQVIGIAHNVSIMPIKAFLPNDSSFCYDMLGNNDPTCSDPSFDLRSITTTSIVTDAIIYAVDNGADIINLSLSGKGYDQNLQDALRYADQNGVLVVASAGNENSEIGQYFPASMDHVVSVGAINSDNTRASYSNYGSKLDVVAPVGDGFNPKVASLTLSCFIDRSCSDESAGDIFQNFTQADNPLLGIGTSYAAPQVSAIAALMKSKNPSISHKTLERVITTAVQDLGVPGKDDEFGYGLVNALYSITNTWNSWGEYGGSTPKNKVTSEVFNNKLYQSVNGWDGRIWTRSFDGGTWTPWQYTGGSSKFDASLKSFNGKLYSAVPGWDGRVWVRSFDGNTWSAWQHIGDVSATEISMEVYNSKLFISYIKDHGEIITRWFDGLSWSSPQDWGGAGPTDQRVGMVSFNGKLYQSVKGWDGRVWVRSFDGNQASNWIHTGGSVPGTTNIGVLGSQLVQVVRGWSGRIYYRFGTSENSFGNWYFLPTLYAQTDPIFYVKDDKILFGVRKDQFKIAIGYVDSNYNDYWLEIDGETPGEVDLTVFQNEYLITVVGMSRKIFTRNLPN
jgi:hypothetical protein